MLASGMTLAAGSALAANEDPMEFGMGSGNIEAQQAASVKPDYATYWVGAWTLESGWGGANSYFEYARSNGVTPAVHLYYWGDDISPECVENGCWSDLHNTNKSREEWQQLTQQLVDNLWKTMDGEPAVVFLETEFNQNGAGTSEAIDGHLAEKAEFIKQEYPNAEVVLPFGNWRSWDWDTFDRAAEAADYVGLQGMRGSTHNSWNSYHQLYEDTQAGADELNALFDDPIFLSDLALSSYPDWEQAQADELEDFFVHMDELKAAGVEAMVYRSWFDNPDADSNNYYGQAEKHWGLVAPEDDRWKPATSVWVQGVRAERSGTSYEGGDAPGDNWSVVFTPKSQDNNWWIEVDAEAHPDPVAVEVKIDDGDWQPLEQEGWGHWTLGTHVRDGATVQFRATSSEGHTRTSEAYTWGNPQEAVDRGQGEYPVEFSPVTQDNNWWIEVSTDAYPEPARVDVRIDDGDWQPLEKQDWGHWALGTHVRDGATVQFRATSPEGPTTHSDTYTWGDPQQAVDNGDEPYPVEFSPTAQDNNWWIEVSTDAHPEPARVDVRIDDGDWQPLEKQDWGHWALGTHVRDGATVQFRATSPEGPTTHSDTYTWGDPQQAVDNGDEPYPVEFSPAAQGNDWWIEVAVEAHPDPIEVEARVDGGEWFDLEKQDWDHWALGKHVEDGSTVEFRAISHPDDGHHHTYSQEYIWN
jgi:expansin (peptidoglycan-binding protein)